MKEARNETRQKDQRKIRALQARLRRTQQTLELWKYRYHRDVPKRVN